MAEEKHSEKFLNHKKINDRTKEVFKLALEILKSSTIEKTISLDRVDWSDLREFMCLISSCRKAVTDGFPLQDYEIGEIALVTDEYMIIYFYNKYEYGMGENYNPHAHEIVFQCFYDNPLAVPHRMCNDGMGAYIEERENCFDAVYECGDY